jgi:hypothetical protein
MMYRQWPASRRRQSQITLGRRYACANGGAKWSLRTVSPSRRVLKFCYYLESVGHSMKVQPDCTMTTRIPMAFPERSLILSEIGAAGVRTQAEIKTCI